MSQRKATAAEISLVHLKNCLVNLPASLVSLLVTVNTVSMLLSLCTFSPQTDLADNIR